MISNLAKLFWVWCYFNSVSTVLKLHSQISFLWNFRDFRVFIFGYWAQNKNPEITGNLYFWIYEVQMHVDLYFNQYFNFLSVKTEINNNNKKNQFNKSRGFRISWKRKIWHMISMVAKSFWDWCHLNSISRVFEITFSYFSILGFWINFCDFQAFTFRYSVQNENPENHGKFLFLGL